MPIGVMNFPIQDYKMDISGALTEAVKRRLDSSKAAEQEAKNPYVGQQAQADLQSTLGKNLYQQLVTQYTPEDYQTTFDERRAISKLHNREADYLPTKYDIERTNANSRIKQGNQRDSSNLRQWIATPEGQKVLSQDPSLAAKVYEALQQSAEPFGNGTPAPKQPATPEQGNDPISAIQQGAADKYAHSTIPAETQKKLQAGKRYEDTVPLVIKDFQTAKPYFSPGGQAKLKADKIKAASGHVTPELEAFRRFEQGVEQLSLQGATLAGVPADQISRGQYNKIFDIPKFLNDPKGAENFLMNALELGATEGEANAVSLGELTGMAAPKTQSGPKYSSGAKSLARSKNFVLHQFNTPKEFQDYYMKQPKMVQDAIKIKLGAK